MLGVIGGMGPQATFLFFQGIINKTEATCDQEHLPMIILNHTTMPDRTEAILTGNTGKLFEMLLKDAKTLEQNGCTAIAIPCNTSHYFVDELQKHLHIPIIHMVRETVNHLATAKRGIKKVAVLATDGTIRAGIYQRECEKRGIGVYLPSPGKQSLVMDIIYREIKRGRPGSYSKFMKIDEEIKNAGCEGAILACTELSCYARQKPLPQFYIDAMDVLIDKVLAFFNKSR